MRVKCLFIVAMMSLLGACQQQQASQEQQTQEDQKVQEEPQQPQKTEGGCGC